MLTPTIRRSSMSQRVPSSLPSSPSSGMSVLLFAHRTETCSSRYCRVGMDLSRVAFPTFVLEPRSMLERITDFMAFPDLLFGFVVILVVVLLPKSHFAPPVPKSATTRRSASSVSSNTISQAGTSSPKASRSRVSFSFSLGIHTHTLAHSAATTLFLVNSFAVVMTIQMALRAFTSPNRASKLFLPFSSSLSFVQIPVSHHPPVSAFFYSSPENYVSILGELRPKSKFLGNSVSTTMEGENRVSLLGRPEDGGKHLSTPHLHLSLSQPSRIHHHHAQYVCPRYSFWQDGPRTRRYMHSQERQHPLVLRSRFQN